MVLYYTLTLITLTLLYSTALIVLRRGFEKLQLGRNPHHPSVSVIVAAKDEEHQIAACIRALQDQTYPHNKMEIIIVDDRSKDETAKIVRQCAGKLPQIKLLRITDRLPGLSPKKRAIDFGIKHAKGDIIFTTDADCTPGPGWISGMIRHFDSQTGMVAGFNPYKTEGTLVTRILALDYFAMAAVAAACAALGFPVSCSGGNLAYRKNLYHEVGGFKRFAKWVSGDDDFLLEAVRQNTDWKIKYAIMPETFVPTAPPETPNAFLQQRIRYASKGGHYSFPVTLSLTGVFFLNLLLITGLIAVLFTPQISLIVLLCFLAKALVEWSFLKKGARTFQYEAPFSVFPLTTVLHPFYLVVVSVLAQIKGFDWKGERFDATIPSSAAELSRLES